jgi:hypothetical protein
MNFIFIVFPEGFAELANYNSVLIAGKKIFSDFSTTKQIKTG